MNRGNETMNLPILSTAAQTMSSREIAELTGKEHKNVMADVRKMLSDLGLSTADFSAVYKDQQLIERPCFNLPKRETLILVSGYSVELRARIIDRWEELERQQAARAVTLPNFTDPAAAAIAWAAEYQAKQAAMLERDEAIRTKAQIGSRREATAMATAAKATREAAKMAELVGRAVNHACVLAVQAATGAKYAWHPLKAHCVTNNLPILRVHSEAYGEVNSYPASAWLEVYGVDLSQLWGVAA